MTMSEPYATGLLAEFAETLRIMSTQGIPVENVIFDFEAVTVTFTYQSTTAVFRLEPTENEAVFLIKFPADKQSTLAKSREIFWRLVRSKYADLCFPELEPELEMRMVLH